MSFEPTLSRVYLRAWTRRQKQEAKSRGKGRTQEIRAVLVLDTETTTETTQRLAFGSARYYRVHATEEEVRLVLRDEWLFHADDLADRDPDGYHTLVEYARDQGLKVCSRTEFMARVFWMAAYRQRATVVGFNLPFDLSRLANGWGEARRDPGFSLRLWGRVIEGRWDDNPYRPRLGIQKLAPGRALIRFRRRYQPDEVDLIPEGDTQPDPSYTFNGHFLDLHTLVFALTNKRTSLSRACAMFNIEAGKGAVEEHGKITREYIDYNRQDVVATAALFEKVYAGYRKHPIDLQPTRAWSPASMGKAYLRAMGVVPPLDRWADFPDELLGYAMTAYYGGRAECRIRHVPMPVVTVDFLSMYTTVCSLMGIWRLLTADQPEVVDGTAEVQELLDRVAAAGPDAVLRREFWPHLAGFAQVQPEGDVLPIRTNYGGGEHDRPQIGVNHFWAEEPFWYSLPDLVASTLLTGRAPQVIAAFRLTPRGTQPGLKLARLRGEVEVDPTRDDFFRLVVEERKRSQGREDLTAEEKDRLNTGLKTVANASAYGITAEMIRHDGEQDTVTVHGLGEPFQVQVKHPEYPGAFCFPPFAAAITGGAHLMLALLERLVTDRGGTYVNCDTDSMAIVATPEGGLISCAGGQERLPDGTEAVRAMSNHQVDEIIALCDRIHPYDRHAVSGSLLEIEGENTNPETGERMQLWCLATSAKRYVLWNETPEGIQIRKASEHGLGHLLDPTGKGIKAFAEAAWRMVLARHLDIEDPDPEWLDRPAVSRLVASTPYMASLFKTHNEGKDYSDQVKPFGFMLSATPKRAAGMLLGVDRLHLVAPFETDPSKWTDMEWTNIHTGGEHRISLSIDPSDPATVPVQTLRDVIERWSTNPELKSLGPDGQPCRRETSGVLSRRSIGTTRPLVTFIGKESNHLKEAQAGVLARYDILNEYPDPERDPWHRLWLPAIARLGAGQVAQQAGVDRRTVERALSGSMPHAQTRVRIANAVMELIDLISPAGANSAQAPQPLADFLDKSEARRCELCGQSLEGRRRDAKFCSGRCRMRYRRACASALT